MNRLIPMLVLAALSVPAGSAGAGSYVPPPGDGVAQLSHDGSRLAHETQRGGHAIVLASVGANGGRRVLEGSFSSWTLSPDGAMLAYVRVDGTLHALRIADGADRPVATPGFGTPLAWSPDSARLAFTGPGGVIYRINADGTGAMPLATGTWASWSPDGSRLAFQTASPSAIHVVRADGTGEAPMTGAPGTYFEPTWSPDGKRIAFFVEGPAGNLAIDVVHSDGTTLRTYSTPNVRALDRYAWIGGQSLVYVSGGSGLIRLDLADGNRTRLTRFGTAPTASADGRRIAFTGAGECRDRQGVYVMGADGLRLRRLSNSCTIVGTVGPDVIHADFSRIVLGLGGNDTLYGDDTGYPFQGNTLFGGRGNDRLVGGFGQDILNGGPGHDHIEGDGGGDTIYAVDGERDWISCGPPAHDRRDVVHADKVDVVAPNCKVVHRQ